MLTTLNIIWSGLAIGFMISAPMGPVGMLCIQRTLNKGRRVGFHTGIGAAISDMLYCFLTGFGLSFIEDFLERHQNPIQLAGSLLLVVYGIYLFRKNPTRALHSASTVQRGSPKRDILGGFLFTFSNPLILFLIIGLFARFNFGAPECMYYHYIAGYLAIMVGALTWWWVVTYFVDKVRSHFNLRSMWLINKIIGCVMLIFGLVGIATAIFAMYPPKAFAAVHRAELKQEFAQQTDASSPLIISNSSDTLLRQTVAEDIGTDDFEWVANCTDRHSSLSKRYSYSSGSEHHKSPPPGWGVVVEDPPNGAFLSARIRPAEIATSPYSDETKQTLELLVTWKTPDDEKTHSETLHLTDKELQPSSSPLSISITRRDGQCYVLAGRSLLVELWSKALPSLSVERIGLLAPPASEFELNRSSLHHYTRDDIALHTPWIGNIEGLTERLSRSSDPLEGFYTTLDFELDNSLLALGGEYKIALCKDPSAASKTYLIYYISGAEINPDKWLPGMLKGEMVASAKANSFSLTWYDATWLPLSNLTATFENKNTLLLYFPYQLSTLRFIKYDPSL